MNAKDFAEQLKRQFESLKGEGIEALGIDNLIAYLSEYVESNAETDIELHKATLQKWVEEHKFDHAQRIEMFKSVIQAGQNALRTAFLMNGGATLAFLTFVGHLSTSATMSGSVPLLAKSLAIFGSGVFVAALATGTTYISQWFFNFTSRVSYRIGISLNILAIVLGLGSYIVFAVGSYCAYKVFSAFTP